MKNNLENKDDEGYVDVGGKRLRRGYTTGTCAAAAATAAAYMALHDCRLQEVFVQLPGTGAADDPSELRLPLAGAEWRAAERWAQAAVTKDGGDDPDITTGLNIWAEVRLNDTGEITVDGGRGVGRATLPGLKVAVGQAAINPVPRAMIAQNVQAVLPPGCGAEVIISAPGGEELARRTFNPRLGIEGGLSILGSTGIVNPMSEEALKESLRLELRVLAAKGYQSALFAFGNYGLQFLRDKQINEAQVIKISNYLGFMLDEARQLGIKRLIIIGHIGKLVKVSAGIFNTHSRNADARMEIITAYAALAGAEPSLLAQLYQCKTTSAAVDLLDMAGGDLAAAVYRRIAENTASRAAAYTYDEITVGALLFGDANRLLHMEPQAAELLKELKLND